MLAESETEFERVMGQEVLAFKMLSLGASKETIVNIIGCMPKMAEKERRLQADGRSRSRCGNHAHFFDTCPTSYRFCNMLWQNYVFLTGDTYLHEPINAKAMIQAFTFVQNSEPTLRNYIDLNKFFSILRLVADSSIIVDYCNTCKSQYLARRNTMYVECSNCQELEQLMR
ncbi:hypothetical protein [Vibrio owensii]|uniref:hypothetical protein n=1 Tax=Vibrio owensii TaxID=696485 RepID=UPI0040688C53